MKKLLVFFLLASPLAAQAPTYSPQPSILAPLNTAATDNTTLATSLLGILSNIDGNFKSIFNYMADPNQGNQALANQLSAVASTANSAQAATVNATSGNTALLAAITALQARVAKLETGAPPPPPPPPVIAPVTFYLGDPNVCSSNPPIDTASGRNVATNGVFLTIGWIKAGQTFTCKAAIAAAANYRFSILAATPNTGITFTLQGQTIVMPSTGSYSTYQAVQGPTLALVPQIATFTVVAVSGSVNLSTATLTPQ